eukprot:CAMPEP_0184492938 /NCGR_PEP_ID=MMETSP0113_2-20130426/24635_1 /TAXON_ID=91329 /ORGANISM="Norrisiella sphaerica, Strain BC52" /LENGTH=1104 /DNA_ID=CAMNT_0026877993 /DNA_START=84 /DNA_END=3398 /DNA_ORIENTATION=-
MEPSELGELHAARRKKLFQMNSVGQLFLKTPKVSGFEAMEEDQKDAYLREQALMLAEADEDKFAKKEWKEVCHGLRTNEKEGLTSQEAELRLQQYGYNELPKEPPRSCWLLFLDQLNDLLVIMLIVAAIVAAALSQVAASVAIIVIVTANAILGVQQEMSAASALEELAAGEGVKVKVIRDSKEQEVDSKLIVPGDIVLLKLGEKIPADMRIIESADLTVKEMNLTGESRPVKKNSVKMPDHAIKKEQETSPALSPVSPEAVNKLMDEERKRKEEKKEKALILTNFLYSSCDVLTGKCKAVVVKSGVNTYVGRIFELITKARQDKEGGEKSPLKDKLETLGKKLGFASLAISIVVFVVGVSTDPCRGCDPDSDQPAWLQMLLVSVSLTVAAVPESLPVCVTLTLALGMSHMAKKKALVRRLLSVETLGSADVICTDKTGTLTAGVMTAITFISGFQTYKITGSGHELEGFMVPEKVDTNDVEACAKAHEVEKKSGQVDMVWASYAMCCNAKYYFEDTESKKGIEKKIVFEGDPTEQALIVAANKLGIKKENFNEEFPRFHENPFNSSRKMMSVIVKRGETDRKWYQNKPYVAIVKGASEQVLRKCSHLVDGKGAVVPMTQEHMAKLQEGIDNFASRSLRVLAVAYKAYDQEPDKKPDSIEKELTLIGYSGLIDPVRPGVKNAIATATGAGIRTVMITGDYAKTAKAIALSIDIIRPGMNDSKTVIECDSIVRPKSKRILEIADLIENKQGSEELKTELKALEEQMDNITANALVFSRAKPEDKLIIVKSFQRQNHVCAMTGDGVNDGPALQRADIGVAMGNGTEVAKGASDMVLTDNNYVNIVEAVEEGRIIYNNITKFVFYLLSTNVAEVFTILFASIIGLPSPLLPTQILWLNLTTDGFPAVALAMEKGEPNIMREGPRTRQEPVIEKVMLTGVFIQTFFLTATCLITYIVGLIWNNGSWDGLSESDSDKRAKGFEVAQTMTIYHIVFAELLRAYGSRSMRESIFTIGVFSNKYMQYSVGASVAATLFIGMTPLVQNVFKMRYLDGREWGLVLGLALIPITVDEITKVFYRYLDFGKRPLVNTLPPESDPAREPLSEVAIHV